VDNAEFLAGDPKDIARAELVRFRKRLGSLTPDQEERIERLLISAATKTSLLSNRVMQSLHLRENLRGEYGVSTTSR